MYIIHIEDFV